MSQSDVRHVESLEDLRRAIDHLSERLGLEAAQLRQIVHHASEHFQHDWPGYWRQELQRAERFLTEAQDQLSRKQSTTRAGETVPATEERKAVSRWKNRVRLCQEKLAASRKVAIEVAQALEKFQGPVADLVEQADVMMPTAATHLQSLIDRLRRYQSDA